VWEEYNAVQDQLEYNDDDDETQQHGLDTEAFTETYCELRPRIDRIISEDTRARDVSSAELQTPRPLHENGNVIAPKIKLATIEIPKFGGQITEFKRYHDTFNSLVINNEALDDVQKFSICCLLQPVKFTSYTADLSCSMEFAVTDITMSV
jgi:hypothetical protein